MCIKSIHIDALLIIDNLIISTDTVFSKFVCYKPRLLLHRNKRDFTHINHRKAISNHIKVCTLISGDQADEKCVAYTQVDYCDMLSSLNRTILQKSALPYLGRSNKMINGNKICNIKFDFIKMPLLNGLFTGY